MPILFTAVFGLVALLAVLLIWVLVGGNDYRQRTGYKRRASPATPTPAKTVPDKTTDTAAATAAAAAVAATAANDTKAEGSDGTDTGSDGSSGSSGDAA